MTTRQRLEWFLAGYGASAVWSGIVFESLTFTGLGIALYFGS